MSVCNFLFFFFLSTLNYTVSVFFSFQQFMNRMFFACRCMLTHSRIRNSILFLRVTNTLSCILNVCYLEYGKYLLGTDMKNNVKCEEVVVVGAKGRQKNSFKRVKNHQQLH